MARDLNEVIDDVGLGPYQLMQMILVGGIMLTDGAEILVASSLLSALTEVWHLTPMIKGLMMSTIFFGVFLGGLIGGNIGDVYGRRKAILLAYIGVVIFGGVMVLAQGPISMLILRFFFGISFGIGVAPGMALLVECSPSRWRAHVLNIGGVGFIFGEIYTSILLIMVMPNLADPDGTMWRVVTLLALVPGFVGFCFACLFLQESPHYLLVQGRQVEAVECVQFMAHMNWKAATVEGLNAHNPEQQLQLPMAGEATALTTSETPSGAALLASSGAQGDQGAADSGAGARSLGISSFDKFKESIEVLCRREYRGIVIGGAYMCFLSNFIFYGLSYAMPQVFRSLRRYVSPAHQVLFVSICDLPGVVLVFGILWSRRIGHRDGLTILAAWCSMLCLTLIYLEHGRMGLYIGLPSAYMIKFAATAFFSLTYVYLAEIFPSRVRASGLAFCVSTGRMGSMAAPMMAEALHLEEFALLDHKVPHAPFLILTSGLCIVAIFVIKFFLHFELKNAPLQDVESKKGKDGEQPRRLSTDAEAGGAETKAKPAAAG